MEPTEKKSIVTVRNLLKVFGLIIFIMAFCPAFMVSCSGRDVGVSVMTAVGGVSTYGQRVVQPYPIMIVCFLIPIAIIVLLFIKAIKDIVNKSIILGCGVLDLIIWIVFRVTVEDIANKNMCNFRSTGWFIINIISLIVIILMSGGALIMKINMDSDLIAIVSGTGNRKNTGQMPMQSYGMHQAVNRPVGNNMPNMAYQSPQTPNPVPQTTIIGYCHKCGNAIEEDNAFCTGCGTPVLQSLIDEAKAAKERANAAAAEAARLAEEERIRQEQEAARRAEEERIRQEQEAARRAEEERIRQEQEAARRAEEERIRREQEVAQPITEETASEVETTCPKCGNRVLAGSLFCQECGTSLEQLTGNDRVCHNCGATVLPDSLFCGECGAKL